MKSLLCRVLWRRFQLLTALGILLLFSTAFSVWADQGDQSLPMGNPATLEHSTPTGATEIAQRLIPIPFTPPDVKLKEKEPLSGSNNWFTKHDKNKIDELCSLDFYAPSGPQSVGVVPKLHNTSACIEIYRFPTSLSKDTVVTTERARGRKQSRGLLDGRRNQGTQLLQGPFFQGPSSKSFKVERSEVPARPRSCAGYDARCDPGFNFSASRSTRQYQRRRVTTLCDQRWWRKMGRQSK